MARKKFQVTFTIEADARDEVFLDDEHVPADKLTAAAVANHVRDLEWSGGCQHPAFALHSNRKIKIANIKVIVAGQSAAELRRDVKHILHPKT